MMRSAGRQWFQLLKGKHGRSDTAYTDVSRTGTEGFNSSKENTAVLTEVKMNIPAVIIRFNSSKENTAVLTQRSILYFILFCRFQLLKGKHGRSDL